jgi:CHU_C Type IX secretion signal domain
MKKALLTFLLLITFPVMASHIVGGEFELLHISGNTYKINMILYFDKINGNPQAKDQSVGVSIFRKSDNVLIDNINLPLVQEINVPYSQPSCADKGLATSKLIYSATITLSADKYSNAGGYYLSWQRCCRNYRIDNIYSENLQADPTATRYAGQTFYLEFPAVTKNGQPFINSSPKLFPPLSDYANIGVPYYVDFAGVDDDKDSLVYSLVTPLNTKSSSAVPPAGPRPYPDILWRPGFSLSSIMNGNPDLKISADGLLTVTPGNKEGLFVFAVKVDEFRQGIKIGESRRDFQMLVLDLPKPAPPIIVGKKFSDADFPAPEVNSMSVYFSDTTSDAYRYIEVKVSDKDSFKPYGPDYYRENIKIKVIPLNFKRKSKDTWPAEMTTVLDNGKDSIKTFRIYFPQCPYINGPYKVGILASDDACSLPLIDTLKLTVNVQPPPNKLPVLTYDLPIVTVSEGDPLVIRNFKVTDEDSDELVYSVVTDGFVLNDFGMNVEITKNEKGLLEGFLSWDPKCNKYEAFAKRQYFTVKILVNDQDLCDLNDPVVAVYKLTIKLHGPTIDTNLTSDPNERSVKVSRKIFESLNFVVTGQDLLSDDLLVLSGSGVSFNASDFSIKLPQASGDKKVSSNFSWTIGCDKIDLKKKDTYTFQFLVIGNTNKCHSDTVDVAVKLSPPDNAKPTLSAFTTDQRFIANGNVEYLLGQQIEINLLGTDGDVSPKDNLTISLIKAEGDVNPQGYTFQEVKGLSPLRAVLSWTPDCTIFKKQVYENNYTFQFALTDDRCLNPKADTIFVDLKMKDIESTDKDFYLPNVVTPNGDRFNDYFALEGFDPEGGEIDLDKRISLPKDNCANHFESVQVFNRWGQLLFESKERKFRWYPTNIPSGVYYYHVKYDSKIYKSSLSVSY